MDARTPSTQHGPHAPRTPGLLLALVSVALGGLGPVGVASSFLSAAESGSLPAPRLVVVAPEGFHPALGEYTAHKLALLPCEVHFLEAGKRGQEKARDVMGHAKAALGFPSSDPEEDWVVRVQRGDG
jgi:hypothetical protein